MNLQEMIAAERSAPAEATQAQATELWQAIEHSFVPVLPTAGAPATAAKASTLGKLGGALSTTVGKVALATALVTGGAVGASHFNTPADSAAEPRIQSPQPIPTSGPLAVTAEAHAPVFEAAPEIQPAVIAKPAPEPEPNAEPEPKPARVRAAAKPRASLQDELALIRRTQSAVRSGAHQRALTLARQHAKTYPDGAFVEDREALRALALCESGHSTASTAASKFHARWPSSMHRNRIEAACE